MVEVVRDLIHEIGYRREIARLYPEVADQESRWQAVEEVVNALGSYAKRAKEPTIAGFLQDIALTTSDQDRDKESKLERDAVVLMTLHAAKGLEFPEVYMVGHGGGHVAPRPLGRRRRGGDRRRAAVVLRGRDPGPAAIDVDAGPEPAEMGQAAADHPQPVPLRDHRAGGQSELPGRQTAAAAEQSCQGPAGKETVAGQEADQEAPGTRRQAAVRTAVNRRSLLPRGTYGVGDC